MKQEKTEKNKVVIKGDRKVSPVREACKPFYN